MRMKSFLIAGATATAAAAAGTAAVVRPWYRAWGRDPGEAALPLAGDEIVPDPRGSETRGITIAAPPQAVWPWLVQMGFGRAGWYSYDALDMDGSSADDIRPELQALAPGDLVPTHPGGGFVARIVRPNEALVLSVDAKSLGPQPSTSTATALAEVPQVPTGLQASGAMLSSIPDDFSASWAFVLQPLPDGRTRLLERFRIAFAEAGPSMRVMGPVLGFGMFVMMRRQLLGIRARAERRAAEAGEWWVAEPVEDAGAEPAAEAATTPVEAAATPAPDPDGTTSDVPTRPLEVAAATVGAGVEPAGEDRVS